MRIESSASNQDVDLNLAPIIDCFTVLIVYLLVSASFLSLTVIDVGVAASGERTPASITEPPLAMVVELSRSKDVELKVSGGPKNVNFSFPIPARSGLEWDFAFLTQRLGQIKKKWPQLEDVSITAENSVAYKDVVKAIETVRKSFPKIFLSGEEVPNKGREG